MAYLKTKKDEDYEFWHRKIETTLQWRDRHWNGTNSWLRYMALYRGDHWRTLKHTNSRNQPDSDVPNDQITVNKTMSTVNLAKSFLMKNKAKFIIKPPTILNTNEIMQAHISSILQGEALNYEWKERDANFQCNEATLDAVVIGHGIVKTGFTRKRATARNINKDGDLEQRDYIEEGAPFVERVNPFRFIFDIESEYYRQLDSCRWVAEIFIVPKSDVLANEDYNQKVIDKIRQGEYEPFYVNYNIANNTNLPLEDTQRCCLYEIWNKQYMTHCIYIKGVVKPLFEEEWPYDYLDGFPYEKVDYIPIQNEHYGVGLPYVIEDQQLELNRIRTGQFDHRRRFNRKYIIRGSPLDPSEENRLISGETGTILHAPQGTVIEPLQELKIPSDSFAAESVINSDIQELTGIDQLARGGNLTSRTSAEEIRARQSYVNLKLDDRVEAIDRFVLRVGRKTLQHIKANYAQDKIIRISGQKGAAWVKFSPKDIKGEFDIDMDTVSAPKVDLELDRQQRIQVFQLLMQNMQLISQSGIDINFGELIKWMLESFNEKDISRFFPGMSYIPAGQAGATPPNTAMNLLGPPSISQPDVLNPSQALNAIQGNQSGGGPAGYVPGVQ